MPGWWRGRQNANAGRDANIAGRDQFIADQITVNVGAAGLAVEAISALPAAPLVGQLITGLSDPFAVGVHPLIEATWHAKAELPLLPPYIPREHDAKLAASVAVAQAGHSAIRVLVGGASSGKTRACWEAIQALPGGWRLWHPVFPDHAEAFLAEMPHIGPRTVVWLNEAQFYLLTAEAALGERVAAGLRDLLRNPERSPVLVLGTIWPQYWHQLTIPPSEDGGDPHAHARNLLEGRTVPIPEAFTSRDMTALEVASRSDPRLAEAVRLARDGQVTQFLSGVPVLLERYDSAPPAAKAVIRAAIDARLMGHGPALPRNLLEAAAPGYLTEEQWDQADEDWLERALAYAAVPCNGTPGPLTLIRARPAKRLGNLAGDPRPGGKEASDHLRYRLADYLFQIGYRDPARTPPPGAFWDAAATAELAPDALAAFAQRAEAYGLYHRTATLARQATLQGNTQAAATLISVMDKVDPGTELIDFFRQAGTHTVFAITERAIASSNTLELSTVAPLLRVLREIGAGDVAGRLADHAARSIDLSKVGVSDWLGLFRAAEADHAVILLAERAIASSDALELSTVAPLLRVLREIGAGDVAGRLADHAARSIDLSPMAVAKHGFVEILLKAAASNMLPAHTGDSSFHGDHDWLSALQAAGADQAVDVLADRIARNTPLTMASEVAGHLEWLHAVAADEALSILLARDPAGNVWLDREGVDHLLKALRATGMTHAFTALAERIATHADLSTSMRWLQALRETGADEAASKLARRAAADADLANPYMVGKFLQEFLRAGAMDSIAVLLARDPATHVALETDPGAVATLLDALREAQADKAVSKLLARDPATRVSLQRDGTEKLLRALREVGATAQLTFLADRLVSSTNLADLTAVGGLLGKLNRGGANDSLPAVIAQVTPQADLSDLHDAYHLFYGLGDINGDAPALAELAARVAAEGDPNDLAAPDLLSRFYEMGMLDAVRVLAGRMGAEIRLGDADSLNTLLRIAWNVQADDAVTALLTRDPSAHVSIGTFSSMRGIAALLQALHHVGARNAFNVLANRLMAELDLANGIGNEIETDAISDLLATLWEAGVGEAAMTLAGRIADRGMFLPCRRALPDVFRFGRNSDGTPSGPWGWASLG